MYMNLTLNLAKKDYSHQSHLGNVMTFEPREFTIAVTAVNKHYSH